MYLRLGYNRQGATSTALNIRVHLRFENFKHGGAEIQRFHICVTASASPANAGVS